MQSEPSAQRQFVNPEVAWRNDAKCEPVQPTTFEPSSDRLRVGIMLDSWMVTRWQEKILADINRSGFAELALFVKNDEPRPSSGLWQTISSHGLYSAYQRVDRQIFKRLVSDKEDAFALVDVSLRFPKVRVLEVLPERERFVQRFDRESVRLIKEAKLDVLIRFGFGILRGEVLNSARCGIWSFHHGDNREYRGTPALFWELYERNPVSGTVLQILTEDLDDGRVIYRSFSKTNLFSLHLNRNAAYWKSAEFAMRRLRDLHLNGWDYIRSLETYNEQSEYQKGIYRSPSNPNMVRLVVRLAAKFTRRLIRDLTLEEHWFIALRRKDLEHPKISANLERFTPIIPTRERNYADPFLIKRAGRNYLFFEDHDFHSRHGVISFVEIHPDATHSTPQVALSCDYHLSFPFLFEYQDDVFMLPETRSNCTIELYRATEFPHRWEREQVLFKHIEAVDSVLLYHEEQYWLFTCLSEPGIARGDELHLFFADSPFGPWTRHPMNPIVSDIRRARSAGNIFVRSGELIRPGQDSAIVYGHGVSLNRIERMSKTEYREVPIDRIGPEWLMGNVGTHTFSCNDDFEAIDGRIPRVKLSRSIARLGLCSPLAVKHPTPFTQEWKS